MTVQHCRSRSSTMLLLSVAATLLLTASAFNTRLTTTTHLTTDSQKQKQEYQKQDTALYGLFDKLKKTAAAATDSKLWAPEIRQATYEMNDVKVKGDTYDARLVRPVLKNTPLESRPLQVAYNAQNDGWQATDFHKKVDFKGPAVVLAKTSRGQWVGAYNPKGWTSSGNPRQSLATFLFYQKKDIGDWQKLRVLNGGFLSCAKDLITTGIYMGPDGLAIPLERNNDLDGKIKGNVVVNGRQAYSKLGTYFERGPDEMKSLFGNDIHSINLTELKVLVGVYEDDEEIPNTD